MEWGRSFSSCLQTDSTCPGKGHGVTRGCQSANWDAEKGVQPHKPSFLSTNTEARESYPEAEGAGGVTPSLSTEQLDVIFRDKGMALSMTR